MSALAILKQRMFGPQSPGSDGRLSVLINWANEHELELGGNPSTFWAAFHQTWSGCDNTWNQRDELLEIIRTFREDPCEALQEECDRAFYASLPDRITIYRGCNMDRVMGLAWTTDKSVALGFAKGHRGIRVPNPVLASAFVRKCEILGAYQERQEREIIVDPALHLSNLRVRFLWDG